MLGKQFQLSLHLSLASLLGRHQGVCFADEEMGSSVSRSLKAAQLVRGGSSSHVQVAHGTRACSPKRYAQSPVCQEPVLSCALLWVLDTGLWLSWSDFSTWLLALMPDLSSCPLFLSKCSFCLFSLPWRFTEHLCPGHCPGQLGGPDQYSEVLYLEE